MSDFYQLLLRGEEACSIPASIDDIALHLGRIPSRRRSSARSFEFGEADEHGVMKLEFQASQDGAQIAPDDEITTHCLDITVPRAWVHERGPQVFAIVFMAAEWLGWTVYDPQIEDSLQKDDVLQGLVAMRQARLVAEGKMSGEDRVQTPFDSPSDREGS